jgi:hypothetical protein
LNSICVNPTVLRLARDIYELYFGQAFDNLLIGVAGLPAAGPSSALASAGWGQIRQYALTKPVNLKG